MLKKFLSSLLLLTLVFSLAAASYEIDGYDIDIKADKDGTLRITETIDVRFNEQSHGIYRDIQYSFENPNGNSFDPIKAEITNVKATSLYKTESEDGVMRLTLGDPKVYANEKERYVIEYDFHLDYNRTVGYDELYYNIISPAWDTTIRNITWSVTLPYPVEKERIWVTEGKEGGTREGSFTLGSNYTVIKGEKEMLLPSSAITLRVEMDEGYWKGWASPVDNSSPFVVAGSTLAMVFAISVMILWIFYGKDEKIDTTGTRTTPPEGINPLDAGFIVDQTSSPEKEGFAMIFKWAEEGRLTVTEKEGDKKGDKASYTFTKLKDLDGGVKESERALFDSIFFKDEVTLKEMVDHGFANDYASKVVKKLTKENKSHRERKSVVLQTVFLSLGLVASIISAVLLSMRHPGLLSLLMVLCFVVPIFIVALVFALWSESGKIWTRKTCVLVSGITLLIVVLGAVLLFFLVTEAQLSLYNKVMTIISFVWFIVGMAYASLLDKKSKEGNEKLQKCLEYRNYLAQLLEGKATPTEDDKRIWGTHMAYALALGLDKKDAKLEMDMPQPTWFYGNSWHSGWFTYYLLFHSCSSSYSTTLFNSTGSTTPGGGGFSSSGFSGGGFSGGGGGSW